MVGFDPVAGHRQHRAVGPQHHRADRHLAARTRRPRRLQRRFHAVELAPRSRRGATDPKMSARIRPVIGVTLDAEPPGGYSKYPWYALRANYADRARRGRRPAGRPAARPGAGRRLSRHDRRARRHRRRVRRRSRPLRRQRPARDRHAEGGAHRGRARAGARRAGARHAGAGHLRRRAAAGGGAGRHADAAYSGRVPDALAHEQTQPAPRARPRGRASCRARCSPASPGRRRCR